MSTQYIYRIKGRTQSNIQRTENIWTQMGGSIRKPEKKMQNRELSTLAQMGDLGNAWPEYIKGCEH